MSCLARPRLFAILFVHVLVLSTWSLVPHVEMAAAEPGAEDAASWQALSQAIRSDAALARFYSFEEPLTATTPVRNRMPTPADLTYQLSPKADAPGETFQVVPGRWPGKKALRLDQGALVGPTLSLPGKAMSIEAWLCVRGIGSHRGGGGTTNGILLALGNGYWEGWRITFHYPKRTIGFEIGRPQPSHSQGIHSGPVADRVWHHIAATWDGSEMRLYVDGLLSASCPFTEAITVPTGKQSFRIGYSGAGMGSVEMDVDEVAIWTRALTVDEVLAHASLCPVLPGPAAAHLRKADEGRQAKDHETVARELSAVLASPGLPREASLAIRLVLAESLLAQGRVGEAGQQMTSILDSASVGSRYQQTALVRLRELCRHSPGALPRGAHQRLLAMSDLTPQERVAIRLAMGHRLLADKQYAAARSAYTSLFDQADAPAAVRSIAALRIAQSYVREGNREEARRQYAKVREMPDVPAHLRDEAQEQISQLTRIQQGLPARDPAASRMSLPKRPAPAVTLHVAATGTDTNPGTQEKPFASLERARDEIRRLKKCGNLVGPATVCIQGGTYVVKETWRLSQEDSGTGSAPIVYQAAPGQSPVFSGGVRLTGFQAVRDPQVLARLPEQSRDKVLQIDLKRFGVTVSGPLELGGFSSGRGFKTHPLPELFFRGEAMQIARWPNQGWLKVTDVVEPLPQGKHKILGSKVGKIKYEGDRPSRWLQDRDGLLYGYWFWDWADTYERIGTIDPIGREIHFVPPSHQYGFRKGQRYYALNLLSELDAPGEWYLDRQTSVLYFYPPSDPEKELVELSVMQSPMVQLDSVSHVVFEGLTWQLAAGDVMTIKGGNRCLLAGCNVRRCGGNAVSISGGMGHGLLSCNIEYMGRGGVSVHGGDRKTLTPGGHFIENCHMHHLSRIDHTYTPAVHSNGVGLRIRHNLLHDITSSAIRLEGNDNTVEFNEVFRVVTESDDQGGADMWGNPTYRGNVYRYNYWHHIGDWANPGVCPLGGHAGIRLDDAISGVLIYGNIFFRSAAGHWPFGGVQIHGGKDNVLDNNLFIDCKTAVSFSPWGEKRWKEYTARTLEAREIDLALYLARYPALAQLGENPDANDLWRNVVYRCGQFLARERGVNRFVDNAVVGQNPGFQSGATGSFSLAADAPVYDHSALSPIPFDEIGLYVDDYRRELPTKLIEDARAEGGPVK